MQTHLALRHRLLEQLIGKLGIKSFELCHEGLDILLRYISIIDELEDVTLSGFFVLGSKRLGDESWRRQGRVRTWKTRDEWREEMKMCNMREGMRGS